MSDPRILLTGANGFIGRALAAELQQRGYSVRCAVRAIARAVDLPGTIAEVADVNATTDWSQALAGVDTVIHLVARAHIMRETDADPVSAFYAVNRDGTQRLAESAAAQGVRRIVYVSSIGVNGDHTGQGESLTEDSPVRPHNAYAASKYAAERALTDIAAATGLEVVILRPPLVYGPGNPGNFLRLLQLVARGIPLPLAAVSNQRSMIYVGNLVDALIAAALSPAAAGQLYLVSDEEPVSTPQLVHELALLLGRPARLWRVPVRGLRLAGKMLGQSSNIERLAGSLVVDSGKIRRELAWSPPFALQQGLEQTVNWYLRAAT